MLLLLENEVSIITGLNTAEYVLQTTEKIIFNLSTEGINVKKLWFFILEIIV